MESPEFPKLDDLWFEADPGNLICCFCQSQIGSATLARTFRLYDPSQDDEPLGSSKIIHTPFNENIVIYDRHLKCLLQSGIKYCAISHVWDPEISRTQVLGRGSLQPPEVRRRVIELPVLILRGLLKSGEISKTDEIWHDYISVPQWSNDVKDRILLAVPDIYGSAHVTTLHFEDLRKESLRALYRAQGTDERLKAITDICNIKWFSRVWTAMEYVRSRQVISIDEDYDVCPNKNDPLFLNQMNHVWSIEVSKHKSAQELEARAKIGKNIVPWALGPIQKMGNGKPSVFGLSFNLLSKRRCQSNRDFLHALIGLVEPTYDRALGHDFDREYLRIARLCIAGGDYSPLLMTPRLEDIQQGRDMNQGFSNVKSWPLGPERKPPKFHPGFSFENGGWETGEPILTLERLGVASELHQQPNMDLMHRFADDASFVLRCTGPDLDSFIKALGTRLYNEDFEFIKQNLAVGTRSNRLAGILQKRVNKMEDNWPLEGGDGAQWVAEAMTLSLTNPKGEPGTSISKIAVSGAHGGTIHLGHAGRNCLVSAPCTVCHLPYVFRAGLFKPPGHVRGAVAYQIRGLEYEFSRENGVGILVKDGHIVGRMAWATPSCACLELEKVKIKMPALPYPSPRPDDL
ncbi:hypothetical protein BKA56DRAFT_586092 [Ilyonectria sp. MPI-CAGE-AT-0026]|nr:hypothetical protein BKA56DRAFT_586092 [Ilyonectria sp. MPI-CAGE-AT-0026]